MKNDLDHTEQIDDYISGKLDAQHRKEFEEKLRVDNAVNEEVSTVLKVIEGIQGSAFKAMLKDLHNKLL